MDERRNSSFGGLVDSTLWEKVKIADQGRGLPFRVANLWLFVRA
jgi:hypothetical protein